MNIFGKRIIYASAFAICLLALLLVIMYPYLRVEYYLYIIDTAPNATERAKLVERVTSLPSSAIPMLLEKYDEKLGSRASVDIGSILLNMKADDADERLWKCAGDAKHLRVRILSLMFLSKRGDDKALKLLCVKKDSIDEISKDRFMRREWLPYLAKIRLISYEQSKNGIINEEIARSVLLGVSRVQQRELSK